jgi:hypothetical protein
MSQGQTLDTQKHIYLKALGGLPMSKMSELDIVFKNIDRELKELRNQVYADHRLIESMQKHNHAQAKQLNRLSQILEDDGK